MKDSKPRTKEEMIEELSKTVVLLRETLSLNEVWLSTGISATGTLLMHLLMEAGIKEDALTHLKKALGKCAVSMGAESLMIKLKDMQ